MSGESDQTKQATLLRALRDPALYPHPADRVETIETHISTVLLAGDYAYKIKKPVDLGFLDFSTLAQRRRCCEEELRLNRRLAPRLYLDVTAIAGEPRAPILGSGDPPIEYAVRMRRFDQAMLLDRVIERGGLDLALIDSIAAQVGRFHLGLPAAATDSGFGTPEAVLAPMLENFAEIAEVVAAPDVVSLLETIEARTRDEWERLRDRLLARLHDGAIRECHGDMHLGNMALVDGEPVIFDGIEFNPALRWIDVVSEIAFLAMDLEHRGATGLAWRFLNRYLELTGDYGGLALLRFYQAYRAMVRAKVDAIRLHQVEDARIVDDCRVLLELADGFLARGEPVLLLTGGLSGSGKTYLADRLARRYALVHLRSDVERKRLHGLGPHDRGKPAIYNEAASRRTYRALLDHAAGILAAGQPVVVDATFLSRARRRPFFALASELSVPVRLLWLEASPATLRARIRSRRDRGGDASDADLAVLAVQRKALQAPGSDEPASSCSSDLELPSGDLARFLDTV